MKDSTLSSYLVTAGLVMFAAACYLSYVEVRPFVVLATSQSEKLVLFSHGGVPLPISQRSQESVITECYDVSRSLVARFQAADVRLALLHECIDLASTVSAAAPTVGVAAAIVGAVSAELGDAISFNAGVLHSRAVSPNELWLAIFRVNIVEDHYELASAEVKQQEKLDIGVLALTEDGTHSIARRYVDHSEFRDRVTATIETMPQDVQQRFVRWIEVAAQLAGTE